jgi:adenylate cyclase, class 1
MLRTQFLRNKEVYLSYNRFRKKIFSELAPKDGEYILYLLPWMLSVNHPAVPGYVPNLKRPIAIFGATADQALIRREASFMKLFGIRGSAQLRTSSTRASFIEGLYTIGSAGTISQTALSDCDIWVCIEKDDFDDDAKAQLRQKLNLVKDWMDSNLRMPVYFFLCDVEDIRNSNFGVVGDESSGSAQHNVLKEEFYRTSILISGKIPLWWVCFDPYESIDYQKLSAQYARGLFDEIDFIDLGPLESVDHDEYFGAALWQFNKALTHPLKSVIKMLLLEMLLISHGDELLCNRFRDATLNQQAPFVFQDPSVFTLKGILQYSQGAHPDSFEFIKQCGYLRYDVKFYSKKQTLREHLAKEIFDTYPLTKEQIGRLNIFAEWRLLDQLDFGDKIFILLLNIYNRVTASQKDIVSKISKNDMTMIGRKLAACLEKKKSKVPLVHKPIANLNLPTLTFQSDPSGWHVWASGDSVRPVLAGDDIVCCIGYLIWNGLYEATGVRMTPNPTPVSIQEIINLAKRIKEIFGVFDVTEVDSNHFLEEERVTRLLIIVNFEDPSQAHQMNDFSILYTNHWGELFYQRFNSPFKFKKFIDRGGRIFSRTETHYYIERSNLYYEKIIERSKELVQQIFSHISPSGP